MGYRRAGVRFGVWVVFGALGAWSGSGSDAGPGAGGLEGAEVRLPVTRDTWFSTVDAGGDGSNGGAARMKLKAIQEMSLVDFDPTPLRGRVIRSARLHLRGDGDEALGRVGVSTIGVDWFEGEGTSYEVREGVSTFNRRRHPDLPWSEAGSDLTSVMFGRGGSFWRHADATPRDGENWQTVAIDPSLVAARVAGVSHGFVLFDDTGSEWTRDGESFTFRLFPNRFVFSKDSNRASAPYFTIETGEEDREAPEGIADLRSEEAGPFEEARIVWSAPGDRGAAGVVGYLATIEPEGGAEVALPQWTVPSSDGIEPGGKVTMRLRGVPESARVAPGSSWVVRVRAVDGAGNAGPAASLRVEAPARRDFAMPGVFPNPNPKAGAGAAGAGAGSRGPRLGRAELAVIDPLDKVEADSGRLVPEPGSEFGGAAGYRLSNHLYSGSASGGRIALHAARGEFTGFQAWLRGPARGVRFEASFEGGAFRPELRVYRLVPVRTEGGRFPDAALEIDPKAGDGGTGLANTTYLAEFYVPPDAPAGVHRGRFTFSAEGASPVRMDLTCEVWGWSSPVRLRFLPEMNCYDIPEPESEYRRLAHRHRVALNRVPYYQNGRLAEGAAPAWDAASRSFDWSAWDRRFGGYLDGSAFADLPRGRVPVEVFYLAMHENWPTPLEPHHDSRPPRAYWADESIDREHREAFAAAARGHLEHFRERGWTGTVFLGFLNNKVDYKRRGWSRGSSPWLLDEPASFPDYQALRHFGRLFQEGVAGARPGSGLEPAMAFRADISRPEWQRDALDSSLDYNVVSAGAFARYRSYLLERKTELGQRILVYGSTNRPDQGNAQAAAWCLDAWTAGADGVIPWQTVGTSESWERGDELALFYPGGPAGVRGPVASARLKSYTIGQQLVEGLIEICRRKGVSRFEVGAAARRELAGLDGRREGTDAAGAGVEDAGRVAYDAIRPADLWRLKIRVGRELDRMAGGLGNAGGVGAEAGNLDSDPDALPWRFPARDLSADRSRLVGGD